MDRINNRAELKEAILRLENQQADDARLVKEQFHLVHESIKPINLIRSVLQPSSDSGSSSSNLLSTSVGMSAGYLSKLLFQGRTKNPIKKLIGTALMFGITDIISKRPGVISSIGNSILKTIISKLADRADARKERKEKPIH